MIHEHQGEDIQLQEEDSLLKHLKISPTKTPWNATICFKDCFYQQFTNTSKQTRCSHKLILKNFFYSNKEILINSQKFQGKCNCTLLGLFTLLIQDPQFQQHCLLLLERGQDPVQIIESSVRFKMNKGCKKSSHATLTSIPHLI